MKISTSRERILELLEITGDTQADMVRKTGIDKSAISHYINGQREPRQDKIIAIANAYNLNPAWLMGLDVSMNPAAYDPINDNAEAGLSAAYNKEEVSTAISLYEKYISADPHIRNAVDALLKDIPPASEPLDKH